jgi:hypothetical protein
VVLDQLACRCARPATESAVERRGGDLHQHAPFDERLQTFWVGLGVSLRVGEDDLEAFAAQLVHR